MRNSSRTDISEMQVLQRCFSLNFIAESVFFISEPQMRQNVGHIFEYGKYRSGYIYKWFLLDFS